MADKVDYGYGDVDYGYGDAHPSEDYGYGDAQPDYWYGDAMPEEDYGYGATDYGYGDSNPDEDYGYGATEDYGYGDADAQPVPQEKRRPKRRCSVTKYSLEEQTPLTAASVIAGFRNGVSEPPPQPEEESVMNNCGKSVVTEETRSVESEDTFPTECGKTEHKDVVRKKGMMNRLRKRLSLAM
jgi:hypothetical protein